MVALPEVSDILIFEDKREMLMEVSNLITPEVYEVIYRMGHMDELVIADANYFVSALSGKVIFSYAPQNHVLLAEILKYFPLDDDEEFPNKISRQEFYLRTKNAYATIQTCDPRLYADIILKKGVVL